MKEPTKEQVKRFWEWCGLRRGKRGININLNNLFEYAVPKLRYFSMHYDSKLKFLVSVDGGEDIGVAVSENEIPALALFWGIWEVIDEV